MSRPAHVMEGPSGVIALVLAETAAGSAAVLWLGGLWGKVRRGFFILTGATVATSALLAGLAASAAIAAPAPGSLGLAPVLSHVTAGVAAASVVLLALRSERAGMVVGMLSVPPGIAAVVALATGASATFAAALVQLLAGAAFMGAVTVGLLLGHWYLVDRGLSRSHIQRLALVLIAAVAIEAVAVVAIGFGEGVTTGFGLILTVAGLAPWLALGMIACTGLLAILIRASLRDDRPRAVQAATGFFYLAVITAFTAEMAAKVGFAA